MSGLCATEAFYPHREIPTEAIFEFLYACAAPDVPATHPRANDPSFKGENLRPSVERVDRHLIITPADERLPRSLDILRSLQETVNDLSLFNQESPFPSYPDPFSFKELCKYADELFPAYNQPFGVLLPVAAPSPVDWSTPLPDYASPSSTSSYERDNEGSGAAQFTLPPVDMTPRPAQDAPLVGHYKSTGQVPSDDQTVPAVEPGAPAVAVPEVTIPIDSDTSGEFNSATDPSVSPATPPHAQEVPLPKPDVQGSQGPVIDDLAAAVEPSADIVAASDVAMPEDNCILPTFFSGVGPSMVTAALTPVQEAALPDSHARASPASVNDSPAPAVERSATGNVTLNAAMPADTHLFRFFGADSSTAPAQEAPFPIHHPQSPQAGPSDRPAAARKGRGQGKEQRKSKEQGERKRKEQGKEKEKVKERAKGNGKVGRPRKDPAPPPGQLRFIEALPSLGPPISDTPVAGPSTFPASTSSPATWQQLGNGGSFSTFRSSLREPIQYDPQDEARKAEAKAAKKSARE